MLICKKRQYDKVGAMLALSSANHPSRNHNRREIRYYKCDICGKYHLTSQKEREKYE